MKHLRISVIALSILAFISCKNQEKKEMEENQEEMTESMTKEEMPMKKEVDFELASKSGSTAMGKVSFVEENGQVTFTARLYGLKPEYMPFTYMKKPIAPLKMEPLLGAIGIPPSNLMENGEMPEGTT